MTGSGLLAWYSPPRFRNRMYPGWSSAGRSPKAAACRSRTSAASAAKPSPPVVEVVCAKQRSVTSGPSPSASKICAPRYPSTAEMPIFDMILRTPSSTAAW